MRTPKPSSARQKEIMAVYEMELQKHLTELQNGNVVDIFTVKDFAKMLHIHPVHLSNTIKHTTGKSPCTLFEERLLEVAKNLLTNAELSIAEVARIMTYDPSNFTKFFKEYTGLTPSQYRKTGATFKP